MKYSTGLITILIFLIFDLQVTLAQLKLFPPWITVVKHVNDNYTVKCEGEGEKVWRHGNDQIDSDRAGSPVMVVKKTSENALYLKFNEIRKELKGFYNCTTNVKGKKYSKGFELIVVKPVVFLRANNFQESFVHNEGDDILLNCLTEGEPLPLVSWFFNGELIIPETNNFQIQSNNSLKISNVRWKNSGTYACRAFQRILQTRNAELTYHVEIRHQPVSYTGQTNATIYGFRNVNKNITCQVYAYPETYFIWYRDRIPMDPRKHRIKIYNEENISILEILLLDDGVWGRYDCEAANHFGFFIHTFDLQPIDKPLTPQLLIYEYSDSAALLSVIIEPYPTYPFTCHFDYTKYTYCNYEEKWKRGFGLECKNERIKNTNKTHCKIDNLKPFTKYAVRATIINDGGSGDFSRELIFRTRKELPILLSTSSSAIVRKTTLVISGNLIVVYLRFWFLLERESLQ